VYVLHGVVGSEPSVQGKHLLAVHEEAHVGAHPILLVDDAKAKSRVPAIEIPDELVEGRAFRVDLAGLRVGEERLRVFPSRGSRTT
jgi:hypothetical protein